MYLFGTASSAKSWILDPLRVIYTCHLTPPRKSGFPLQDLPSKEVILWQDFRLDEDMLSWGNLLLHFEGTQITIRRPRTEFLGDIDFTVTQPVFITSAAKLTHRIDTEQNMMDCRFQFFHFSVAVPKPQARKIPPCGPCFASLWLSFSTTTESSFDLPRCTSSYSSSSSSSMAYCGNCSLLRTSFAFCPANGNKHD